MTPHNPLAEARNAGVDVHDDNVNLFPAAQPAQMVKPLVWHDCTDGTHHDDGCQYEIVRMSGRFRLARAVTGGGSYIGDFSSVDAAKDAAQAEHARRILAELQPDAQDGAEIERLREENSRLQSERRTIVSHATMGGTDGVGLSTNAVCVEITKLRNALYDQAEAENAALKAEVERLRTAVGEAEDKFHVLSFYISDPQALDCCKAKVSEMNAALRAHEQGGA